MILVAALTACSTPVQKIELPYSQADFHSVIDGLETGLFTLKNSNGMVVTLTNYGAKIVSIYTVAKDGTFADVMQGFNSIADYIQFGASHGATVGPYANRIEIGRASCRERL